MGALNPSDRIPCRLRCSLAARGVDRGQRECEVDRTITPGLRTSPRSSALKRRASGSARTRPPSRTQQTASRTSAIGLAELGKVHLDLKVDLAVKQIRSLLVNSR